MKSYTLHTTETYPDYVLTISSNNFGDQLIAVTHETIEGYKKNVWFELNHEGQWREVTPAFVAYMKNQVTTGLIKYQETKGA